MKRKIALLWSVHPLQGLAEIWLVGLLILAFMESLQRQLPLKVYQSAFLFLCGGCGMWAVLRIRFPSGNWWRRNLRELAVGAGLSLVMLVGLRQAIALLNWDPVWSMARWDNGTIQFLLANTGAGYFLVRGFLGLRRRWDVMRRRRMLWSLTHAHLLVVVFFISLTALGVIVLAFYSGFADPALQKRPAIHILRSSVACW